VGDNIYFLLSYVYDKWTLVMGGINIPERRMHMKVLIYAEDFP